MACNCPNIDCILDIDTNICTCTTVINNISCPEGCTTIIQEDGNAICQCLETVPSIKTPVALKDYATDASWTIAYSPIYDSFISYYDFFPNYALSYTDYFATGINYSYHNDVLEEGIWSHLLTNKSFQVFYGKKYAWTVEYIEKNEFVNKLFSSISIWAITHRYHNESDIVELRKHSFNKALIYNNTNNSGWLDLRYEDNYQKSKYPIQVDSLTQAIPVSHVDEKININYFFNRVKNQEMNTPQILWDNNEIDFDLNQKAISFSGKQVLERLRGDWFKLRFTQDKSSLFKQIFKWSENDLIPYT